MIGDRPADAIEGKPITNVPITAFAQAFNDLYDTLNVRFVMPTKNYLSLEEMSAVNLGLRTLPDRNEPIYTAHIAQFRALRQPDNDEVPGEAQRNQANVNAPPQEGGMREELPDQAQDNNDLYYNQHTSPNELYNKLNVLLLSQDLPVLMKPGKSENYTVFPLEWLLYCALILDPRNLTGAFWRAPASSPQETYPNMLMRGIVASAIRLRDFFGFSMRLADTYNHALSLYKAARIRDKFVYQGKDRENTLTSRINLVDDKIHKLVLSHYRVYTSKVRREDRARLLQPVAFALEFGDALKMAFCVSPLEIPSSYTEKETILRSLRLAQVDMAAFGNRYVALAAKLIQNGCCNEQETFADEDQQTQAAIRTALVRLRINNPIHNFIIKSLVERTAPLVLDRSLVRVPENQNFPAIGDEAQREREERGRALQNEIDEEVENDPDFAAGAQPRRGGPAARNGG